VPGGFQIANSKPPGGLFGGGDGSRAEVWFGVDDIEAGVARVRELGGEAAEPEEIESGWMASCRDDQGTNFNIWAPKPGFEES
jgi:predicted enzyme related to lactoylglutathione lyase